MNLGLHGKVALITGASQGIGLEIARSLADEGVVCVLLARDEAKLIKAQSTLSGVGHNIRVLDILDGVAIDSVVGNLMDQYEFDICIHNVGGTLEVKNPLASKGDWAKVWDFNVGNAIHLNNLLIPSMQKKGFGRIVHVSSISGESLRGSGPYAAAKAYLNAYIKILGRSLAQENIVVSGVLPGAVYAKGGHWDEESPHNKIDVTEFFRKKEDFLRHHHAIGRLGRAEEIAPWVVFLCSNQASFAVGALIPIDGGTM